jgi:hypothetical protein
LTTADGEVGQRESCRSKHLDAVPTVGYHGADAGDRTTDRDAGGRCVVHHEGQMRARRQADGRVRGGGIDGAGDIAAGGDDGRTTRRRWRLRRDAGWEQHGERGDGHRNKRSATDGHAASMPGGDRLVNLLS